MRLQITKTQYQQNVTWSRSCWRTTFFFFFFFNDNRRVTSSCWRNHRHLISSQLSTKQFLTRGQVTLMAMTFRHFTLFFDAVSHVLYLQLYRWTAKCLAVQHLPRYPLRQATSDTDRTYITRPLRRRNDKGHQLFLKTPLFSWKFQLKLKSAVIQGVHFIAFLRTGALRRRKHASAKNLEPSRLLYEIA